MSRLAFLLIAAFWVTMNVLLWRTEYGSHGGEVPVPPDLVWRKILTAPDTSTLTVYQDGQRIGFCQVSTSVEREMAALDGDKPPPEGFIGRSGYQVHLDGNISFGDFTNRVRFDGRLQFSAQRAWRELHLKLFARTAAVEIHSAATNQTVHLKITVDKTVAELDLGAADLQSPDTLWRAFMGGLGDERAAGLGLAAMPRLPASPTGFGGGLRWEARRDRLMIGREPVTAYRLETRVLDHPVVVYVSPLGEILRVELPGGVTAALDQWSRS